MTANSQKVQMPVDPALHPAHVVAVRPDVDGAQVKRGDYVLSIETPKGARNVVAPADGRVEVHVSLMQDVEPNTLLFSIAREAEAPVEPEAGSPAQPEAATAHESTPEPAAETAAAEPAAPPPPAEAVAHDDPAADQQRSGVEVDAKETSRRDNKGLTTLQTLFGLVCIASAVLLPGVFYVIAGPQVQWGIGTVLLPIGLLSALLITIWLLSRIRALGGSDSAGPASAAFMFAVASFGLSLFFPSVRSFQESAVAPVKALVPAQFSSYFSGNAVARNQQNIMIALSVYDLRSRGFDSDFRSGSQYQTKKEKEEMRDYNRSVMLAKSSSSTSILDKLPYFKRLPRSLRQTTKEELADHDWDKICENIANFSSKSFELPISDVKSNREAFLLSASRLYTRNDHLAAAGLTYFVGDETALDIAEGKRPPLTCEDMWALNERKNLVQSSNDQSARAACKNLRNLSQCIVDLEKKVATVLPKAQENGQKIDKTWEKEYLDEQGNFVFLLSK